MIGLIDPMAWLQSNQLDVAIFVTAAMCAIAGSLLSPYMVLRRMSMMGDAISHAVLPGIAIAFLISGSRDSGTMFIGAAIVGVLTAVLTQLIHQVGKVETDASMGVVFTTLFAIGLILIVRAADHVDLDPGCVLYGSLELSALYTESVAGLRIPRAAIVLGLMAFLNLLFVSVFYKELKITSFDPELATTLGINAAVMHYALMVLVAMTTVAAFEAVGSILVVALLIVPGATASLLTDRLSIMVVLSVVTGLIGAVLGHVGSIHVPPLIGFPGANANIAGMIGCSLGLLFVITVILAPRYGLLSRAWSGWLLGFRIVREDALGLLYRLDELEVTTTAADLRSRLSEVLGVWPLTVQLATRFLRSRGLVARSGNSLHLTALGRQRASQLVRSHRLWEAYLVKHVGLRPDHVHGTAMDLEHYTSEMLSTQLAERLAQPDTDPHGRPIPAPDSSPGES